ncbi:hypothetical protein BC828DRAFT_396726 [Blastocladiella britannica]|nr:hypothetical protein BC828DRAFT_396726 [Blastocladiella britannica]
MGRCTVLEDADVKHRDHVQTLSTQLEQLTALLEEERTKAINLEGQLTQVEVDQHVVQQLQRQLDDARHDRAAALDENSRLMDQALESQQVQRARNEQSVHELRSTISHLESANRQLLLDMKRHLDAADVAKVQVTTLADRLKDATARADTAAADLADLKKRVHAFAEINHVSAGDVQEALVVVAWRRQHNIALDTLLSMHEWVADKAGALHLRREYLVAVHDLDRTRQLLSLQQEVNREYKDELASVHEAIDELRQQYLQQRHADARIIDAKQHRIVMLERQLREAAAHGTASLSVLNTNTPSDMDPTLPALVLKLHQFSISPTTGTPREPLSLLFVLDFYMFDSVVSPMAPIMHGQLLSLDDWTVAWPLNASVLSDAFFWHLDSLDASVRLDVVAVRPDATFVVLGSAVINGLGHLLTAKRTGLQYTAEVRTRDVRMAEEWIEFAGDQQKRGSDADGFIALGHVQVTASVSVPLEEAWLAYQEGVAPHGGSSHNKSNLDWQSSTSLLPELSTLTATTFRTDTLTLTFALHHVATKTRNPSLYAVVDVLHKTGQRVNFSVVGDLISLSDAALELSLVLAPETIAKIAQGSLVATVFDDADPDDASAFLGQARIPLNQMLELDHLEVASELVMNGQVNGSVAVIMAWKTSAAVGPRISKTPSLSRVYSALQPPASWTPPPPPVALPAAAAAVAAQTPESAPATHQDERQHWEVPQLPPKLPSAGASVTCVVTLPRESDNAAVTLPASNRSSSSVLAANAAAPATVLPASLAASATAFSQSAIATKPAPLSSSRLGGSSSVITGDVIRDPTEPSAPTMLAAQSAYVSSSDGLAALPPPVVASAYTTSQTVTPGISRQSSGRSIAATASDQLPRANLSLLESALLRTSSKLLLTRKASHESTDSRKDLGVDLDDRQQLQEPGPDDHQETLDQEVTDSSSIRSVQMQQHGLRASNDSVLPPLPPSHDMIFAGEEEGDGGGLVADENDDSVHLIEEESSDAAATGAAPPMLYLSPSVGDDQRAEFEALGADHVTIVLHTIALHAESAVVNDHLAAVATALVAFDLFAGQPDAADMGTVETSGRGVRDADTGALLETIDLGLVASFPTIDVPDIERWQTLVLAGHPTTFVLAVQQQQQQESHEDSEFVDVASGVLSWDHVVEAAVAAATSSDPDVTDHPTGPLVFAVELEFLDGVGGAAGTLCVEVHGLATLMQRLGMAGPAVGQL